MMYLDLCRLWKVIGLDTIHDQVLLKMGHGAAPNNAFIIKMLTSWSIIQRKSYKLIGLLDKRRLGLHLIEELWTEALWPLHQT